MKLLEASRSLLRSLMIAGITIPVSMHAAERVGDFSLLDQHGNFHNMRWYDDHSMIALLVQANGSEAVAESLPQYLDLHKRFADQGIRFMLLNPMGRQNRNEVADEMAGYGVALPVLMDDAQLISEALGVERLGEVILFDPQQFTVEFVGDVAAAAVAIERMLDGKPVPASESRGQGEIVRFPVAERHRETPPSYADEVAHIVAENCASCHRDGGIAPFAMDSHEVLQRWSPVIREVIMTKRMPPGQIDPHIGEFSNDMVLDSEDQQALLHWIEAGSAKDGDRDPLTELRWPDSKWAFGEPDYIIKVPPQEIPATGVLDYIHVSVPIDIPEDRWLRGSQYVAGDRTVLHHTLNGLSAPGASRRGGFLGVTDPDQANITPYIPGAQPRLNPPNTGGLLKAGSTLNLQLHYTTNGKATVDASEIGLWFYPKDEVPEKRLTSRCACIFTPTWTQIPPGDPNFVQSAQITLEHNSILRSFTPHMHFRGKNMQFFADYPDGSREQLINIANYNYNWQLDYTLEEPKFVPAGTVITAVGAYDNSAQNLANPDPTRWVPWGQQSWDEMFFGAVGYQLADE